MKPAVVEIIGQSGSGKTTLIERIIPEIRQRQLRLAVIKHTSHRHEFDRPGKDSYRMRKAGAEVVLVASPAMFALFRDVEEELSLKAILSHVPMDIDLVLAEGYRSRAYPAIEVYRPPVSRELLAKSRDQVRAVVTESEIDVDLPVFSPRDIRGIVDFIVNIQRE
ncbi:MAG: molybdopterin-guanine dinucleotide biosynthesis protein B [candidate division KSB1 bacterium]|nr:molybdopterin-guanine dinucleotide biosynthesis protein B [candidate division KSB1 bacterium]